MSEDTRSGHVQRSHGTPVLCSGNSPENLLFYALGAGRSLVPHRLQGWRGRAEGSRGRAEGSRASSLGTVSMSVKCHRSTSSIRNQTPPETPKLPGPQRWKGAWRYEHDLMLEPATTPAGTIIIVWTMPSPCDLIAAPGHAVSKATQVSTGKGGAKNTEQVSEWDPALLITHILSLITRT